ncbi:hypothetical protein COO91_04246 [Nostoc flagelliforme CCNUN1]|uniref:Uncharacterized protein n=1 Tax=Nostoc flagelliforme CCNUN1 TaxID=2038116 RepID=A0A2K8SS85_9NOSO|nr:hypothetical protein COO91_04246 [Nostoc flagelliforme CCNUN1]
MIDLSAIALPTPKANAPRLLFSIQSCRHNFVQGEKHLHFLRYKILSKGNTHPLSPVATLGVSIKMIQSC